jgi:glucokinase
MTTPLSLVADIGGTNTRVALAQGTDVDTSSIRRFRNTDHADLTLILSQYLADTSATPEAVCVAVAGPVSHGVAKMTNLETWHIDETSLGAATGAKRVALLNDLQAQGYALSHLTDRDLHSVITAPARMGETCLVIGVGTGFNAAPVLDQCTTRLVPPSECGHANLPIRTEEELRLCRFVEKAHGFPAIEDVLSGRGLERVYHWLGHEADDPKTLSAKDIMEACQTGSDPRAVRAAEVFAQMLGRVVGNLALIHLPFGGIHLIGGVARALAPYLGGFGFETSFKDKGRFAEFMSDFSVSVVLDDYAALTGSASYLSQK